MLKRASTMIVFCVVFVMWALNSQADTIFQSVGIASSPNPVGSGARALGMGGAFIAVADDATAASWNPAGLVQLERPEFSIVGDYQYRKEDFSSSSQPEIDTSDSDDATRLNFLSATYPFSLLNRNMVVSANYQRLYDFDRSFEHPRTISGAVIGKETVEFDQDGYLGAFGLAYALELTPWLSLGATLNIWTDDFGVRNGWDETVKTQSEITAINSPFFGLIQIPPQRIDVTIKDEYENFSGTNWNFGVMWNITPGIAIGGVFKTAFWGDLDHTFTQITRDDSGNVISEVTISEDAKLHLPMSFGGGISYRFSDLFTMDLDVYRTDWSDYYIKDGQGNKFSPIDGRPKEDSDVEDTTQARLGAEYLFLLPEKHLVIPVRAGVFYDPEPKEGSPEDFYGVSIGSGIGYKEFIFDIAYQFRWGNDVEGDNLITTGDTERDVRQHSVLASIILHF
jgi:long-subunit fatty acid transport protein